jgi:hypothetical protein
MGHPINFSLVLKENGIHSFTKGAESLDEFMIKENQIILKDAIMFMHHGIELLMKQILVNKSEFLIFEDLQDAAKKQKQADSLGAGIFFLEKPPKTVSYEEAINRVEAFVKPPELDQKLILNLTRLNQLRNQLEHYALHIETEKIIKILSEIREPLFTLFENQIGGIKKIETKKTKKTWDDIRINNDFQSSYEKRVFELLIGFDFQEVPGRLLGIENNKVLPHFHYIGREIIPSKIEGVSSVDFNHDFYCESEKENWIIEVKGKVLYTDLVIKTLQRMRFSAKNAQPWLIVFSTPTSELIKFCKNAKVYLTGEEEWYTLEKIVLQKSSNKDVSI